MILILKSKTVCSFCVSNVNTPVYLCLYGNVILFFFSTKNVLGKLKISRLLSVFLSFRNTYHLCACVHSIQNNGSILHFIHSFSIWSVFKHTQNKEMGAKFTLCLFYFCSKTKMPSAIFSRNSSSFFLSAFAFERRTWRNIANL